VGTDPARHHHRHLLHLQLSLCGLSDLAAGALLYVLGELLPFGRRLSWEVTLWGLLAGFLLGFATELVLAVAGG
jgi:hypothetical protein